MAPRAGADLAMDRQADHVLAWKILRRSAEYRDAWDTHAAGHEPVPDERGPFRIRVQSKVDRKAARFGLLAWEDPRREWGPASPFWLEDRMPEGVTEPDAEPLAGLAAEGGFVAGLRLLSGELVVKLECRGAAVQVLVGDGGPFPHRAGLRVMHDFGLRMPRSVGHLIEFWSVAGRAGTPERRGRRDRRSARGGFWK